MLLKLETVLRFCLYEETGSCTERKVGNGFVGFNQFLLVVCELLSFLGAKFDFVFADIRTAEELVPMIAHFYYNAKRPSWIDVNELSSPY